MNLLKASNCWKMVKSSDSFYSGLLEWDYLKTINVNVNILLLFIGPLLLYSVIWYERFGADLIYRTLINQVSISSTFYARVFHTKVLFCQNVTRENHFRTKKTCTKCWWNWLWSCFLTCVTSKYVLASSRGVNFTNILWAAFLNVKIITYNDTGNKIY